ncbi:MAG: hypothetical protein SFV22_03320 [Saprospiraceae bacterium]|nr:hypothetical protein [Saprospiraceae bacterium]
MIYRVLFVFCLLPGFACAQQRAGKKFARQLLLGAHYGYAEDYRSVRDEFFERENYVTLRTGISLAPDLLYGGIQARLIRARNFESDDVHCYMAGVWARGYLLHPSPLSGKFSGRRIGVLIESGFLMGNYAFDYQRNGVRRYFQRSGNWYVPMALGVEFRIWRGLTIEGALNMMYNNGGRWDEQGIGYLSLGLNGHF